MTTRFSIQRGRRQGGFVLVMMGVAAIAMLGAAGMAVDLGRMFIVKHETQVFCDAHALSAAMQLDGTTQGLTNATNAVTSSSSPFNMSSTDKWDFNTTTVSSPTVTFGATSTGPWYTAAQVNGGSVAVASVSYAKVDSSVSLPLFFMPMVMVSKVYSETVNAESIAGAVSISSATTIVGGLFPFTVLQQASTATGPDFGLTPGNFYDIQWPQFNGNRKNCGQGNGNESNCFNQTPCAGDSTYAQDALLSAWGSQNNGYWGSNSASVLNQQILDQMPLQQVTIGDDFQANGTCGLTHGCLNSGNKQSTAKTLDDRAMMDTANTQTDYASYMAATHNGRRLVALPILNPSASGNTGSSPVVGFAEMLLEVDGSSNSNYYTSGNGNAPYCAIYVGPGHPGGMGGNSTTSTTGMVRVRLVQ